MFRDLSFRYKIPLRGTALILITASIVTSAFILDAYQNLKQDLILNAEGISRVMAYTLVTTLRNDDVWQAYEIIRSPLDNSTATPKKSFGPTNTPNIPKATIF